MDKKRLCYYEDLKEREKKKLEKVYKKVKDLTLKTVAGDIKLVAGCGSYFYTGTLKEGYEDIDLLELALIANEGYNLNGGWVWVKRETREFEIAL